MASPPSDLIRAFEAAAKAEDLGAVMVEDGWNAEAMRVLAATQHVEHRWIEPKRPCPDGGRATPAAWAWLISGLEIDFVELAAAADVTVPIARRKWMQLASARLVMPDGSMTKWARAALKKHVAQRLGSTGRKAKQSDADDAN